jgi:calcium release-activated calcium channel protein 1
MSPTTVTKDSELESSQYSCSLLSTSGRPKKNLAREQSQLSSFSAYSRPQLSHQGSLVFPRSGVPIVLGDSSFQDRMSTRGVDENIYHWKILNLSRAKLKASSRTSALLSGFAMVAMVEIQIDENIPPGLLVSFAVCTVLLIAVHMLALMISTCILPNVEAVSNLHIQGPNTVFESPHSKMSTIIEMAWAFSTVLGILLFLVEICILCWVKFYTFESHMAAWVATGLLIPIFFIFIAFAAHFYLKLVGHKSEVYEHNIKELQLLKDQLDDPGENLDAQQNQNNIV